jgi:hypothetical protein
LVTPCLDHDPGLLQSVEHLAGEQLFSKTGVENLAVWSDIYALIPLSNDKTQPFRYFKTSPEIIRLAVMLYVRFPLSLQLTRSNACIVPPSGRFDDPNAAVSTNVRNA